MQNRPYKTIEELLWNDEFEWRHSKFNKRGFDALIKCGAFESMDIVGDGKMFSSYHHMHETLLGSHFQEVTKKKKGVMETFEVELDHSALIKRAPTKDPHEGLKNFYELVRTCADVPEWTSVERAQNMVEVFGSLDVTAMIDKRLLDALESKNIQSIDDLEQGETKVIWFVVTPTAQKKGGKPVVGLKKKTKNGKEYVQIFTSGPHGKSHRVSVWGRKELPEPFTLYCAEVKKDEYGNSTASFKMKELA